MLSAITMICVFLLLCVLSALAVPAYPKDEVGIPASQYNTWKAVGAFGLKLPFNAFTLGLNAALIFAFLERLSSEGGFGGSLQTLGIAGLIFIPTLVAMLSALVDFATSVPATRTSAAKRKSEYFSMLVFALNLPLAALCAAVLYL